MSQCRMLDVVTLQCVTLARLNFISQNFLFCTFPITVDRKKDSSERFGEKRESSNGFVTHILCHYVLTRLLGYSQACKHSILPPVALVPGPVVYCIAQRQRASASAGNLYHQSQRQQILKWCQSVLMGLRAFM